MSAILETIDTFQVLMSPLKEEAPANMASILETIDTFHVLMSPLKKEAA